MSRKTSRAAMAAFPLLLLTAVIVAQEAAPAARQEGRFNRRQNATQQEAATTANNGSDAMIAMMVIPGNQEEIALGQLAEQRSMNKAVKGFAQEMIQAHTQFLNQLRPFAGIAAGPVEPAASQVEPQRRSARDVDTPAAAPGARLQADQAENAAAATARRAGDVRGASAAGLDVMHINQLVAQRCQALTQQLLSQKQGAAFDKGYIGCQIGAHVHMLAKLEVLSDFASPELRQVLEQGLKTTQSHLQHAERTMAALEQTAGQPPEPRGADNQ